MPSVDPAESALLARPIVLFDLDGTLTDSSPGITRSLQHALAAVGVVVDDPDELRTCIGPPFRELFPEFGITGDRFDVAYAAYRARYDTEGAFENSVYPGVVQLLDRLVAAGRTLGVATSKPEPIAVPILEHFDLARRFSAVAGATFDQSRATKAEVVDHALAMLGRPDPADVVLVGDRHHDVDGGHEHGLAVIGVRWGFAHGGELDAAGADLVVDDVEALATALGLPA